MFFGIRSDDLFVCESDTSVSLGQEGLKYVVAINSQGEQAILANQWLASFLWL